MELDFNELRELLTVFGQTDVAELAIKSGEFELTIKKSATLIDRALTVEGTSVGGSVPVAIAPVAAHPVVPAPALAAAPVAPPINDKLVDITSPMVGTFYRAPAPDESPFVDVGDRIRNGQTVCIIEAMKLMNEIESEVVGEIVEILVQNGEPVEYGQTLMRVNPA